MKQVYNFDGTAIPAWVQLLFWLLYMLVFVYAFKKTILSWHQNKQKNVTWLFAIYFILFAIFYCINDDYFQYREWIYGRDFSFWGKEYFYVFVILFCQIFPFDYLYEVFRLIVWGGAILIAYNTFRMYRELLMPGMVMLFLFVFYVGTFCYARASLAMAVYFMGIALYLSYKRFSWRILGIIVAISSYFLHHEMLVSIALLPCLFIPFERKRMSFLSVFGLIIAIIALSFVISNVQFLDSFFDNDEISTKIENFNEKEQGAFRLSTFIKYFNFFYPFYLITNYFWKKAVPTSVIGMYRIAYGILMISVAFMVVSGPRSVYTYRIMYISMIPLTLLIGYGYFNSYFTRKQFQIMMILALLSNSIRFINSQDNMMTILIITLCCMLFSMTEVNNDYDLHGKTYRISEGYVSMFDGRKIKNGTLVFPDGKYLLQVKKEKGACLVIGDNTELVIDGTLQMLPNGFKSYDMIRVVGSHVKIHGKGSLVGDKSTHTGKEGEWGMGLRLDGSCNVTVSELTIADCWGDCIYIGGDSKNIQISNCQLRGSRRQGISITKADGVTVSNCKIADISGTNPQYAIDIEPNKRCTVDNVLIENVTVTNCEGGFRAVIGKEEFGNARIGKVEILNCNVKAKSRQTIFLGGCDEAVVNNCVIETRKGEKPILSRKVGHMSEMNNKVIYK